MTLLGLGKLVLGKKNNTICLFCNKHLKGGGITRLKQYLAGLKGEVEACKNVLMDVKWQMNQTLERYKQEKVRRERISKAVGEGTSYQALDEEEEESSLDRRTSEDTSWTKKKRSKTIGGFFAPRTTPGAQPSIKSALSSKQTIDEARMAVARWWYDANIPFNATLSLYYQPAIDAMLAVGPGFKGPSYHDLRCPLLNNSVHEIREYLLELREVTRYIYNHAWVLNTMRKDFTNGRDLCRLGITSEPLVRVLHLTDADEKPVMGYLYDAMDKAKEAIKVRIIRRTKDALDPISLENIDVLDDWVSEEPSLLDEEDIAWEIVEPPSLEALTLDDGDQEPNFDDAADDFPNENESQYDYWEFGGHNDLYVYIE
ncbi:hypothetical protein RHSIM_Rhsim01G0170300 [Rhododendron simsii]|uniref:Uncharacterized protein n=1 Tax=Rhododendron simsii TaxID=118357 RepID=A0A834M024_RHOSS|nr:hypothetical protein RHSIM_Rhsim01G0170300 [Rhododendron simsii]